MATHIAGFDNAGFTVEHTADILQISSGRTRKLRNLHLLRSTPDSGKGKRERLSGVDIAYLSSARNRPLPVDTPTLVCSMGVEHDNPFVPTLWFSGDTATGLDGLRECLGHLPEDLARAVADRELFISGYWRVHDNDAYKLEQGGIIVASYTGFILAGARVVQEVPGVRRSDGARCFVVRPLEPNELMKYTHNYVEPKQGPIVEFLEPEEDSVFGTLNLGAEEFPEFELEDIEIPF